MYTREVKETSSKPPKQLTAKDTLDVIEAIIEKYENLQDGLSKRTNLDAKESRVPGMTKREGWIAFKVNGELQNPRDAASCFTRRSSVDYTGIYMKFSS